MAEPYAKSPYYSTNNQYIKYDIWVDLLSQDIATNTSSVRVRVWCWRTNNYTTDGAGTCYCNINGSSYSASWSYGQKPISYNSDTLLFDKTVTISHDADGSKSIYVEAKISHERFSSSWNGFTVALTAIPRKAEIVNAPNFNDTQNPAITYTNPAGTTATTLQACISLDGSTPSVAYRDINKEGDSYTFNLTSGERNTLLAATPNSNTLTVYFMIKTVLGGATYTSSVAKTMSVISANPTISGVSYKDTNATTTAITLDDQNIVQGVSTVQFNFATLTALKGATLASISVTANGVGQIVSLSGTTISNKTVNFGVINSSMNVEATIVLTDSRGNTATETVEISMLEWKLPTANITCNRKFNFYSETYLTINATYSSIDGHNTLTIQYRYKEVDAGSYGAWITALSGITETINLDNTKEWNVQVEVSDSFGTTTYNLMVYLGAPILFIDKLKRSVSINGLPTAEGQIVANKRFTLNSLSNQTVADLWCNIGHGANLYLKNEVTGKTMLVISSSETSGAVFCYDTSENIVATLSSLNNKGTLTLKDGYVEVKDSDGDELAFLGKNSYGSGGLSLKDGSGNLRANIFVGSAGDGSFNTYDSSGNNTINGSGQTGILKCKKVRASEGVEELYDGSLSSGNTTFNYGNYNLYIVVGEVRSGGSLITMTIPKILLSGSDQSFCISDEADYVTFKLKYSSSTATLTFGSRSSSGSIVKVYGVN